ncbi:MAG: hypothetical protein QM674_15495 [Burkholderiaceae bacterium]
MRRVLLLLIVANTLAFLWWRGSVDDFLGSPREPDRVARQINPDALKIVPPSRTPGADGRSDAAAPRACIELGPMEEARAARLREFIDGTDGVVTGRAEPIESQAVWMVYANAAESVSAGQRRVAELQRAGIMDIYLMPDGPFRNAISFGLFRTEEAARAHGQALGRQGVKGVRITRRNPTEVRSMVELRYPSDLDARHAQIGGRLSVLVAELGLHPVPCHGKS